MKRYKILYLLTHPIQYQVPMIKAITESGYFDFEVVYCSDISLKKYFDPGFKKTIKWDTSLTEGYTYSFLPSFGSRKLLTAWQPFNFGLASMLKKSKPDALWIHGYSRPYFIYAMMVAKLLNIKVFLRDEVWQHSKKRTSLNKIVKPYIFKIINKFADIFLAIGTKNKEFYEQNGIKKEKIIISPYTVDNVFFQNKAKAANTKELKQSLNIKPNVPVILYASKLSARKKATDLLQAYINLKSIFSASKMPYLLFVGDGELYNVLNKQIKQQKLFERVKLLGFKNQTQLPKYYALSDIFVLPSFNEAWGLVINEAMNAKNAIIASNQVGSAYDLVKNNINGYIFEADNIPQLTQALSKTLKTEAIYKNFGYNSLKIINNWSFKQNIEALLKAAKQTIK